MRLSLLLLVSFLVAQAFAIICYEGTRDAATGVLSVSANNCTRLSPAYTLCIACYIPPGVRANFSGNTYTCGNNVTLQLAPITGARDCTGCATDRCNNPLGSSQTSSAETLVWLFTPFFILFWVVAYIRRDCCRNTGLFRI